MTVPSRPDACSSLPASAATSRTVLLVVAMASLVILSFQYGTMWFLDLDPTVESTLVATAVGSTVGLAVTALGTLAGVLLIRRRPRGLVDIDRCTDTAPVSRRVEEIAARLGVVGRYRLVVAPLDGRVSAHVRPGSAGPTLVVLSGGLLAAHTRDRRTFDGVVAHELAHVRNGDVLPTTLAIAAWRSTLVFGVLPQLYYMTLGIGWGERIRLLALVVTVYVVRVTVLRSREYWADVRARAAGYGDQIREVLEDTPDRASSWRAVFALHPARRARIRALSGEHLSRLAAPLEGTFLAGLTIGLSLYGLTRWSMHLTLGLAGPGITVATVPLIVGVLPLVPYLWATIRMTTAAELRWTLRRFLALLAAFSAGAALGSVMSGVSESLSWLALDVESVWVGPVLVAAVFAGAGLIGLGWSLGLAALWSDARPWAARLLGAMAAVVTVGVLYLAQILLQESLSGGWALFEQSTREAAAAAATVPWTVPYWAREFSTGSVVTEFDDWPLYVASLLAMTAPLLVRFGRARPGRRRAALLWLGYLLLALAVNTGIASVIVRGPGTDGLFGDAYEQLLSNANDVGRFVQLLCGGVLAMAVAARVRRGGLVLGASAGAFTVLALTLAYRYVGLPLRCVVAREAPYGCSPGRSGWVIVGYALDNVGPGLVFCAIAAALGCLLRVVGGLAARPVPAPRPAPTGPAHGRGAGGDRDGRPATGGGAAVGGADPDRVAEPV